MKKTRIKLQKFLNSSLNGLPAAVSLLNCIDEHSKCILLSSCQHLRIPPEAPSGCKHLKACRNLNELTKCRSALQVNLLQCGVSKTSG
jgi:hypothetical protein